MNHRSWKWLFMILLLWSTRMTFGQTIQVVDKSSQKGISDVILYNLDNSTISQSDDYGYIDISKFNSQDVLSLQHPSYYSLTFQYKDLQKLRFKIELEEKIIRIKEIVISASKWEQDPDDIPNMINVISPLEIRFNNPPTTAEVLAKTGQVFVQKSQHGGGSPMIRGFGANSVLIVVDGVRMNNAIYRGGNVHNVISVDPNSLEQAEVLFGPGSVMYGSDALGGVMDFHTYDPILSNDNKLISRFNSLVRYSSASNEKTYNFNLNLGGKKFSSFTNFTYSHFDNLVTGSNRTDKYPDFGKRPEYIDRINNNDTILQNENVNEQIFSGYSQTNLIQKFKYRPGNNLDLTYAFHFSHTSDVPRYDRLIEYDDYGLPVNAEWYYYPQQWMMHNLTAIWYKSNSLFDEARLTLSFQDVSESRVDRKFQNAVRRTREERVGIASLNLDLEKALNNDQQLYYGLEYSFNKVKSTAFSKNIETNEIIAAAPRYPDGGSNYSFTALYGSYQNVLNQHITLSAGARYTQTWLNAETNDTGDLGITFEDLEMSNGALNGNLGLVYKASNKYKFNVLVSSGFRAPNVDDVGKLFDSEPGKVIVPNEDLTPEYTYNIEAGITRNINHTLQVHMVGFYTYLKDAMVRRDYTIDGQDSIFYDDEMRKVQALVNTGEARIYGFSFLVKGNLTDHWSLMSSINYMDGIDLDERIPLRHTSPLFGTTSVIHNRNKWKAEFYTQYSGGKAFEDLAPSEQNKLHLYTEDGALPWYTLNLKGSWTPVSYLSIDAGLENIMDYHYRPYSSGISATGRNFIFALRFSI